MILIYLCFVGLFKAVNVLHQYEFHAFIGYSPLYCIRFFAINFFVLAEAGRWLSRTRQGTYRADLEGLDGRYAEINEA